MDNIIEPKEVLKIGKRSFDVSNVPMYKKRIARRVWDEHVKEMGDDKEYDMAVFDDILDIYGLYLIRQDLSILALRMPFIKALYTYIKRYILSVKYIRKQNEQNYNEFQDWAYYTITGTKKKELETVNLIQEMEIKALQEMEKLNLSQDQLMELLSTFLRETAGNMNISPDLQKAQ